jgi:two-component system, OmpR family, alkaline phosphatase synthesis response regulator PhoP
MAASVLIADDDPNILRALSFLMRHQGYSVRAVADGQEALDAIAEDRPDLLLLDLMMPKANGLDVCKALRSDPTRKDIRIIMLTARGRDGEQATGLAMGADAYITKPFAIGDVVECVAKVLAAPAAVHSRIERS